MSKEKNKNTFRIGALLLVACLISSVMLSGTFAKYTSEYAGQDTALVARWSFTSNLAEATAGDISLPIWDHTYATNIYATDGTNYLIAPGIEGSFVVDFTYDADVDAELIFNFTKSGNYGVDEDEAAPVPIQYSLDPEFGTVFYSLDELENAIIATAATDSTSDITWESATDFPGGGTYLVTHTATAADGDPAGPISINTPIYWKWPYNVSDHNTAVWENSGFTGSGVNSAWTDADDTAIGISSATANRDSYVLNLQIKATQLPPGPTPEP
jgi:hypothetical protein